MSEPKQYRATATCAMLEGPHFETFYEPMVFECFVRYEDYARLKAELERVTKENETINKDRDLLWASHKIALQDIQGLHYALQVAKEGK